jgi:hypothetical protein
MQVITSFKFIRAGFELESKYNLLNPSLTKEVAQKVLTNQSKQIKELRDQFILSKKLEV